MKKVLMIISVFLVFALVGCTGNIIEDFKNRIGVSSDSEANEAQESVVDDSGNEESEKNLVYCYFDNVNYEQALADKQIQIIPAVEITYEQYEKVLENNSLKLGGKQYEIDTTRVEFEGAVYISNGEDEYYFTEPSEHYPLSVIEGYREREPVTLEISDDLVIRYGVLGYNEANEPYGYETFGKKTTYTADEYFPHFEEYQFVSRLYRATIKDGELVTLDVMYHP